MAEKEKVYVQSGGGGAVAVAALIVVLIVAGAALYFLGILGPQDKKIDVNVDMPKVESPAQ